jgi:acyl-CoA dehydrogenase
MITDQIEAWFSKCPDPSSDPIPGMAESGLLAPSTSYREIARIKSGLTERTGLLGVGGVWGGRQMVGRWFIGGFGTEAQKAAWLGRTAAVAISEPGVGAHPKLLSTRADHCENGWRITGEKAWCSNGPIADVLIVLAVTADEAGRKRYSMFLVPRGTPGLTLKDMPGFHALRPSRHCQVILDGCEVSDASRIGPENQAYERMALPFRDVEDGVGTFGILGAFRFLFSRLRQTGEHDNDTALSLGGLMALTAVYEEAAKAVVSSLDQGLVESGSATLVGLRLLAGEILRLATAHVATHGPNGDAAVTTLLGDIDATFGVARGPRLARQARLGMRPRAA